ncbi:MFS transporter [Clostridium gelidum]|uniref:MFS transporter n=1 Tax=Clostridium gelidum TaxID=704125 RepID=A0ABM7T9X9_9CLOT|nr:MFS transporter [Clostridium gelidum]BCZ48133.1 MFS transporter [Clostridium gelidum]
MNNKSFEELKNEGSSVLRLLPHRLGNSISKQLPLQFIIFLMGQLVSKLGDALYTFAIPWISYELTHSVIVMGSMYAVSVLPVVLFGPIIGVYVDRWDRRRLMMFADVTRGILVALVPLMQMLGILQLWQLYVVSFILAGLSLLFDVSVVASIPNIIGNKNLTKANASYQLINQAGDLIGPLFAGIMITTLGGYRTLWFDAVSFAGTLWAIWRIKTLKKPVEKTRLREIFHGMNEGLHFLTHDKLNLSFSLQAMIGNFGYSAAYGVLMFYLLSTLHLSATQVSYNYSFIGLGGLLGSIIVVPLERYFRRGVLIPILLIVGTCGFLYALITPLWLGPGIAFGIVTICNVAWNTIVTSVRQETVPSNMLGRVLSFSRVFTRLAMPLGMMVGSLVSNSISPVAVFAIAAVSKGVEVSIALLSPIRKL